MDTTGAHSALESVGRSAGPSRTPQVELDQYLADCRALVLAEIERLLPKIGSGGRAFYELMFDYPLREAKGLRPALAIATCRALGGKVEAVLPSAAVLELYHNAFLIHDDVEDDSLMRRGRPALHQEHGVPIAINVGDAMLALTLEPLLKNMAVIGLGPSLLILQAVARMTRESVEGQALELDWIRAGNWDLTDDDYVDMVNKKTGWYSFITPMVVGALSANVSSSEKLDSLSTFARSLGVAFQIQDDILNLDGELEDYGKEIGGDLWEGKRTVILLHALRTATAMDRQRAVEILSLARPAGAIGGATSDFETMLKQSRAAGDLTEAGYERLQAGLRGVGKVKQVDEVRWLHELVLRQGSIDYARAVASSWAERAARELEAIGNWVVPSVHRAVLEELVGYVHRRLK